MKRKRVLDADRDHLVHVLPTLEVSGCYAFATTMASELYKDYAHTLLFENPIGELDPSLVYQAQASGMMVHNVDRITPEVIDRGNYTGAILYNVRGHPGIGKVVPTIYYSYGIYDMAPTEDVIVPCSEYAVTHSRYEEDPIGKGPEAEYVIPPMVRTRMMRRIKAPPHPFVIGILTSGAYDKYPCGMVIKLLSKLPGDAVILLNVLPKYLHPGMPTAIAEREKRYPGRLKEAPVMPLVTLRYLALSDVVIVASRGSHREPYGRLAVEAMAMGKPVICERSGIYPEMLEHGVNALLYDTPHDALDHVARIRRDVTVTAQLAANAQMWASWQDTAVHIGKLKRVLRMIGA